MGKQLPNGTTRFEGTGHERAGGSQRWFCVARRNSPVPVPCNLNHPNRRGRKLRAGKEVPNLAKGHRVGAAQVPARTYNVPTLASSPNANTLKECKRARQREAKQDGRLRRFPGKLPKNADFLWTGLPDGP